MAGWLGELELAYGWQQEQTIAYRTYASAPLKLQRSFYPEGGRVCHNVLLHTAGGYVGGDRLRQTITLDPHCHALITTAAAAKVYGRAQSPVEQQIHCTIGAGASLEWLPQETILFHGAQYHHHLHIDLAPTAHVCLWEMTRFGRTARGEAFLAGHWRSRTDVWQAGVPLWIDRQYLEGTPLWLASRNGLAECTLVGTLAWIGAAISPEQVMALRELGSDLQGERGVSRLIQGVVCRYRGHSTAELRRWFIAAWQLLRHHLHPDHPPCQPRVWPL